ncbi:hypothetical protein UlMin_043646 [Ulmus minor]
MAYYSKFGFHVSEEDSLSDYSIFNEVCSFIFHVEFREADSVEEELEITSISRRRFVMRREAFFDTPITTIHRMLSAVGVMPSYIDAVSQDMFSNIVTTANLPHNIIGARLVCFSLQLLGVNPYSDHQISEWNLMESVNQDTLMTVPATKSFIEALEEVEVENLDTTMTDCRVCLEEFLPASNCRDQDHKKVVCLPCSHLFHKDCIVQWLEKSHFCPLCRYAMPS